MERQKLMGDSERSGLIINRLKYDSTKRHGKSEEQSYSLIDKGRIVDNSDRRINNSDKIDRKDKSNFMSMFSDLFGVNKTRATDNSLPLSTAVIFVLSVLLTVCVYVDGTPVNSGKQSALFSLSPSARNIRHLPCISRRTKQEGICMFAIECVKANGTHLGTCIDRFYFGSCCQMPEDVPPITDNHIDDNSIYAGTYSKPQTGVKGDQVDKLDNSLNALSSSSSTAQSTSHKTVITTQSSQQTPKPTKASVTSPTRPPVTTQSTQQKVSTTNTKPPSHRPTFTSNRPATQKYGSTSTSQKFNTTTKPEIQETSTKKPDVTTFTRRPHPSTGPIVNRRPITTGVIVNNTVYTGKLPAANNTKPLVNLTIESQPNKEPELMPSMKPMRNTTIYNVVVLSTTSTTTTTPKPFYQSSRFTTTQRPKNVTQTTEAYRPITTTKFSTTQFVQETKKTTVKIPETTTEAVKLSTFFSVQGEETKKPTSVGTKKPFITGKPTPTPNIGSQLPFGTRLPSGSPSSHKPSTFNKPTTIQSTQTKPISTVADTIPPSSLTPTRPTQKPNEKPTSSLKPEKITLKPIEQTFATERPLVQRPQNSTLSNRRPTIKPTPPFKKPDPIPKPENVTSIEPTKKPTTIVYRPSVETRPSLKPTYISQKPSNATREPTTSVTFRPSTIYNRRPTTTENSTQYITSTTTSTEKPVGISSYKPTSSWSPTKRPTTFISTLNTTRYRPTSPAPTTTTLLENTILLSSSSTSVSSTTNRPISSFKPSTKKPIVKPPSTPVPVKPSTVTKKPVISSTINDIIDGSIPQKPTTTFGQKPLTSTTTEQVGLVTWTNYQEPAVTPSSQPSTTPKDEGSSSVSSSEGWVILETISPPNGSASTAQPTYIISSSHKPVPTRPTIPSRRPTTTTTATPIVTTTGAAETSTSKAETNTKGTTGVLDSQTTEGLTTKLTIVYSTSKPTEQATRKPVVTQTTRKPVFEMTTRTPIPETTTKKATTSEFSTKPIFTVNVTTKPLQKPSVANVTETPAVMEFSTFMSVSGGPTTKPSVTLAVEKNVTSSPFADGATSEGTTVTTESYGNGTTTQAGTTLNTTMSADMNTTTTSASNTTTESSGESTTQGAIPTGSLNMSDFRDVCGRRLWPEARVVGGAKANFGKWPWQVSLRQWRTSTYLHKCGAALLSDNWAITAAHCVDNVAPSDLLLRLGEHDLGSEDEPYGYQERRVQIVASHPQFDPRTFEYDLALLRFYEPVNFQPNILPVCVPTNDEGFVGKTAFVTGWGRLYEDGPLPSVLQEVRVPVLKNEDCEQMYRAAGYIEHIPHIFICAGWRKGGFDSCEGDSGGPLVLQRDDNRFQLAGIISWGIGCAEPNQPGVYTRISEFRDWINQILQF